MKATVEYGFLVEVIIRPLRPEEERDFKNAGDSTNIRLLQLKVINAAGEMKVLKQFVDIAGDPKWRSVESYLNIAKTRMLMLLEETDS